MQRPERLGRRERAHRVHERRIEGRALARGAVDERTRGTWSESTIGSVSRRSLATGRYTTAPGPLADASHCPTSVRIGGRATSGHGIEAYSRQTMRSNAAAYDRPPRALRQRGRAARSQHRQSEHDQHGESRRCAHRLEAEDHAMEERVDWPDAVRAERQHEPDPRKRQHGPRHRRRGFTSRRDEPERGEQQQQRAGEQLVLDAFVASFAERTGRVSLGEHVRAPVDHVRRRHLQDSW